MSKKKKKVNYKKKKNINKKSSSKNIKNTNKINKKRTQPSKNHAEKKKTQTKNKTSVQTSKVKPKIIKNKENTILENSKIDNIIIEQKNHNHKNKSIIKPIVLSITLIIFIITTILFIIKKNLKLELIGETNQTIEVYSDYHDPGYKATMFNKKINNLVKIKSYIDKNTLGTYQITYKLTSLGIITKTRNITIVDTEKPTITLTGNETINLYIGDTYEDEGVTIKDNYDKNINDNLIIENNLDTSKVGTYKIIYTISDSSKNINSIERTINVKEKKIINKNTSKECNLTNPIEKYICQNNYNIAVGYYNLVNRKTYYYQKNKLYYGASLIKTLDALYLYDKNLINDNLKEYVKLAITISDNPSHNYLVNYIGKQNLRNYGKSLGAKYTLTDNNENFGFTNVNDQIAYMKRLYEITKDGQNEELKSFFLNTRKNYLLFDNSPKIMHKYGHWEPVYHNSGIVLDKNPYIVVILTQEGYNNYQTIIKNISKMIYEYHYTN